MESTTASKSKGNVKFNLDENTELKFELPDENVSCILSKLQTLNCAEIMVLDTNYIKYISFDCAQSQPLRMAACNLAAIIAKFVQIFWYIKKNLLKTVMNLAVSWTIIFYLFHHKILYHAKTAQVYSNYILILHTLKTASKLSFNLFIQYIIQDDSDSNENQQQNDTEEETEPEENYRGSPAESRSPRINPFTSPMTNRESTVQPLKNVALTRPPIKLINKVYFVSMLLFDLKLIYFF